MPVSMIYIPYLGCINTCVGSTTGIRASLRPALIAIGCCRFTAPAIEPFQRAAMLTSCTMGPAPEKRDCVLAWLVAATLVLDALVEVVACFAGVEPLQSAVLQGCSWLVWREAD